MGETTAAIAKARPADDFLGIEVHSPGVGSLLKLIEEERLRTSASSSTMRSMWLRTCLRPGSLSGAHVFFPDPWPKKRHHKRRLLQKPFVSALAERLAPGGYLHIATDWEEYAIEILETLRAEPVLLNTTAPLAPRRDIARLRSSSAAA